jgi:hypothetical protein
MSVKSGEHQPTRVVKPDSKFSRLLRFGGIIVWPIGEYRLIRKPAYFAPFQRATVTRKNLAGMQVASLFWF